MIPPRFLLLGFVLLIVGCTDPIHQRDPFEPAATEISISSEDVSERYNWPLSSGTFLVAKPPQLAYVTSFGSPLEVPDRVDAPIVPWSDDDLHPTASALLHRFYDPWETELKVHATIESSVLCGPLAFDVSYDGKRLVTVEPNEGQRRLGLYNMQTGKLIGHMKLPAAIGQQEIQSVRFCGKTSDFMLASSSKIFRLSGKNGSVLASGKGPNGKIRKWIISHNSESMAMLTESGRVLGGDTMLKYFSLYNLGKDAKVPDIALSPKGTRLITALGQKLRTYRLRNHQIVGFDDLSDVVFDAENVAIGSGVVTDAWVNGRDIAYSSAMKDGQRKGSYEMFWRPKWVSACHENETENWFLTIGDRLRDGKEELVMFDYGPNYRGHSVGHVLKEMPEQIQHSRMGENLAILDSEGLKICQRHVYQRGSAQIPYQMMENLIKRADLTQIDKVCEIIRSQKRAGNGKISSELITLVIESVSNLWRYVAQDEPESELLKKLDAWYSKGSGVALAVSAHRHYAMGWEARGDGFAHTITAEGGQEYEKRLKLAAADLEKALQSDFVTVNALSKRISVGLETEDGFKDIDIFCRQAAEISPDDPSICGQVAFKLTPQWYGEVGDSISFALSCSRMLSGADADLMYAKIIGGATRYVPITIREFWASYDAKRMKRGIAEWQRRKLYADFSMWSNEMQLRARLGDGETADQIVLYMMSIQAAPSAACERQQAFSLTRDAMKRLRK